MTPGDVELDGDLAARAEAKSQRQGEGDLQVLVERLLREYLAEPDPPQ